MLSTASKIWTKFHLDFIIIQMEGPFLSAYIKMKISKDFL